MEQTVSEDDGIPGSARSFFDSASALVTVKGVVLLVFLTGITAASVATGGAVDGVLPGAVLAALLGGAVVYEDLRNDIIDAVGVVAIVLATAYTGLEYIGVNQGMWFPLAAAFLLFTTAGGVAWMKGEGEEGKTVLVENLDIVGLHGGILFVLYSILFFGAPVGFILSPVVPGVLLFFTLSLLGTTVAYAARSPPVDATANELHQKLVSVVRHLADIDEKNREDLGQNVRSVAESLSGVRVPTRVEISDGSVPVVLPVPDQPVYESHDVDDLMRELKERSITGYAVHEDGNVLLAKEGELVVYYISPKDEFGTNPNVLPYGYFGDAQVFTASYAFVDAVESVLPTGRQEGDDEGLGDKEGESTEEVYSDIDSALDSEEIPDEDEVEAEAEAIAREKDAEDIFSEAADDSEVVGEDKDEVEAEAEEIAREDDAEENEETEDEAEETEEENKPESSLGNDTDISEKIDDASDMFE